MQENENKSIESYPSDVIILNLAFYDQSITLQCAARIVDTLLKVSK
jgi:hypothetical protein